MLLALSLALAGTTGCYSYRPLTSDHVQGTEDIQGKVVRVRQGPLVHDMKVTRVEGPWISGEIEDEQGNTHVVTMDLRTTGDLQVREMSKGAKAGVITAGSLTGAGIVVGILAAIFASWSSSLRFGY